MDLTEDFQKLSPPELRQLFICPDSPLRMGAGHYNEKGNEFVARKLYSYLLSRPEIQKKFAERQQIAATVGSSQKTHKFGLASDCRYYFSTMKFPKNQGIHYTQYKKAPTFAVRCESSHRHSVLR